MNDENIRTSLGKWSVAFALIPLILVFILLLLLIIPAWIGHISGEAGLGLLLALGVVILFGSCIVVISSLVGLGLATIAIYKTSWRRGVPGLISNLILLLISGSLLLDFYYRRAIDPDRLPIASGHGDYKTVEKLLAKGFDVNRQCGGSTALGSAAGQGNEKYVKILLAHGANVNLGNPLSGAAENGHEEIAKILLDKGADPNCVYNAIHGGHLEILKILLNYGADINKKVDSSGRTLLQAAVENGQGEILEFLIKNGADVNAHNDQGETSLHVLVRMWPQNSSWSEFRPKAINMLIENGADIEAKTKKGKTPLILAVEAPKSFDAIKILLEHGADINTKDKNGNSALFYAMQRKDAEILKLFVHNGADENAVDSNGISIREYLRQENTVRK